MKYSFLSVMAGLLFQGSAVAAAVFTDLSKDSTIGDITYTASTSSFSGTITKTQTFGGSKHPTVLTLNLNLTELESLGESPSVTLASFKTGATTSSYSLLFTSNGLEVWWEGAHHSSSPAPLSEETLQGLSYTAGENKYVTLTLMTYASWATTGKGVAVYDSQGNDLTSNSTLTNGSAPTSIEVNTSYVTGVGIQAGLGSSKEADIASIVSTSAALKVVPEPATAALSLLGLAGLALRRRRA